MLRLALEIGVSKEYPQWLQIKVRLCNVLTYLIAMMAFSFLAVTYNYFRSMTIIPAIAIGFCMITPLMNYLGHTTLSRIVISIVPICLATLFTASMTKADHDPDFGFWAMALSVLIIPFILFDHKEIFFSAICFNVGVVLMLLFRFINALLEFELPYGEVVAILSMLSSMTAFVTIFVSLFWLSQENYQSEKRNVELLDNVEKSRREAENSSKNLLVSMAELKALREEERVRQWIDNGVANVIRLTRNDFDEIKMFDNLLKYIVNYVGASQGALFVNDFSQQVLSLTACYAYSRKKHISRQIQYGEGLIGQCYFERQPIHITQVPKEYIKITSGLGESLPRSVHISPLIYNKEVEGILELASFKPLTSEQTEFLDKISEYIGVFIRDNRKRIALMGTLLNHS